MPDVFEVAAELGWPDYEAESAMTARLDATPRLGRRLGRLGTLATWLAGVQSAAPPTDPQRVCALVIAADHGVTELGVSATTPADTAHLLSELAAGRMTSAVVAATVGARLRAVDAGGASPDAPDTSLRIRAGSGRIDREDALSDEQVTAAIELGMTLVDQEQSAGLDLLVVGAIGSGATTPAAALASILTGTEPVKTTGRGSGIDDEGWMRKATAVRDARRRGLPHRTAPLELLAAVGGVDLAVLVGVLIAAAARRVPVVLDGLVAVTAALLAREIQPRSVRWLAAGPLSGEPAHEVVLRTLGLTPILDLPPEDAAAAGVGAGLGVALGDGSGGLLAVPVLRAATRLAATLPAPAVEPVESVSSPDV